MPSEIKLIDRLEKALMQCLPGPKPAPSQSKKIVKNPCNALKGATGKTHVFLDEPCCFLNYYENIFHEKIELCVCNRHKVQIRFSIWSGTIPKSDAPPDTTQPPLFCASIKCQSQPFYSHEQFFRHVDACQELMDGTYMCPKCEKPETLPLVSCTKHLLRRKLTSCMNIVKELSSKLRTDHMFHRGDSKRVAEDSEEPIGDSDTVFTDSGSIYGDIGDSDNDTKGIAQYLQETPNLWPPKTTILRPSELAAPMSSLTELHEDTMMADADFMRPKVYAESRTQVPSKRDIPWSSSRQAPHHSTDEVQDPDLMAVGRPSPETPYFQSVGMPATQPLTFDEAFYTAATIPNQRTLGQPSEAVVDLSQSGFASSSVSIPRSFQPPHGRQDITGHVGSDTAAALNGRRYSHIEPRTAPSQYSSAVVRRYSDVKHARRLANSSIGPSPREYDQRMSRLDPIDTSHFAGRPIRLATFPEREGQSVPTEPQISGAGPVSALSTAQAYIPPSASLTTPSSTQDSLRLEEESNTPSGVSVRSLDSTRGNKRQSAFEQDYIERSCDECSKVYTGKHKSVASSLCRHKKRAHGADKDKTYVCSGCRKSFSREDNCKIHQQTCAATVHNSTRLHTGSPSSAGDALENRPDALQTLSPQPTPNLALLPPTGPGAFANPSHPAADAFESPSSATPVPDPPSFDPAGTYSTSVINGALPSKPVPDLSYTGPAGLDFRSTVGDATSVDYVMAFGESPVTDTRVVTYGGGGTAGPSSPSSLRRPEPRRQRYSMASNDTTLVDEVSTDGCPGVSDYAVESP